MEWGNEIKEYGVHAYNVCDMSAQLSEVSALFQFLVVYSVRVSLIVEQWPNEAAYPLCVCVCVCVGGVETKKE